jgi:hypothetical protein
VCAGELKAAWSVTQPAGGGFCHVCASALDPEDEVVQVLGRPVHASCAVYRGRRSA